MISLKTVRNHVSNIFAKLQVSDRSAAIGKAREAGMGGPRLGRRHGTVPRATWLQRVRPPSTCVSDDTARNAQEESATTAWFAIRLGPSSFGIFDVFPDDAGRDAHLSGRVAVALGENTGTLFSEPTIEKLDVLASKLPARPHLQGQPADL